MHDLRQSSSEAPAPGDTTATTPCEPASVPPSLHPTAAQRYQLLAEIARGGMGAIWRATDTALSREVAVKVLQDRFAPNSAIARRFAAEAHITAQLQHPAIPPVHDCGTLPEGRPFLAMKLIKGQTLANLLRQRRDPVAEHGRFLAIFEQVCQAVAYAHAHRVIHHQRFELALEAIKTFHTGVSEDVLLGQDEFKSPRERLLREAARFYGKLQEMLQDQPDVSSQRALAESYFLLGDLTKKIGSREDGIALHRKALELRRALAARSEPGDDLAVARSLLALGYLLGLGGNQREERKAAEEALKLAEAAGDSSEALNVLADCHSTISSIHFHRRQWKENLRHAEQELAIRKRLADANPEDASQRQKLAGAYDRFGIGLRYQGKHPEALQAYQMSIAISESLARGNPADAFIHNLLARTHNNKGMLLKLMKKLDDAASEHAKAVETEQKAIEANPAVSSYKNNQAFFGNNLGDDLSLANRRKEAVKAYQRAATILQPLTAAHPTTNVYGNNLGHSHTSLVAMLVKLGKAAEALSALDEALSFWRKQPDIQVAPYWTTVIARERGLVLRKLGRSSESASTHRESIRYLEKLKRQTSYSLYGMAGSYALIHELVGDKASGVTTTEASAAAEQAVTLLRRSIAAGYRDAAWMRKDPDLNSLRKRPDFEKMLADLEKQIKPAKK